MSEKCPKCGGEVAYYQVTELGCVGSNRHIGCNANEGACLLAKKTWTLEQWEELKAVFASADEGYPGAAHDALERETMLRCLWNRWDERAEFLSCIVPGDGSALRMLRLCMKEFSEELGRGQL